MKFEDLMIERSIDRAEEAEILENRFIAIRNRDRLQNAQKVIEQNAQKAFEQNAHRKETITRFRGVYFVNDSKSENINSTYFCMNTVGSNVVWIAGGNDAQVNYQELVSLASQKVKALICIGNNNTRLVETFEQHIPIIFQCNDMEEAVRKAFYAAQQGDTVLLSTASPCDNRFENYQERGNAFKKAIAQL